MMPGKRLGNYHVIETLGKGGMGVVYLARDGKTGKLVVLKTLTDALSLQRSAIQRFRMEVKALSLMDHANIVKVLTPIMRDQNTYFYAMEYFRGKPLSQVLATFGRLSARRVVAILISVLEALESAHARGVVHRDLKPSNILIDRTGRVKVSDFGIARAVDMTRLTTTGEMLGTPAYMSPEQINGKEIDHRTDLYSLGVMAYEMLTGRVPFHADNPMIVLRKHLKETPTPIEKVAPGIPAELSKIVKRALEKKPAKRFQNATEMKKALQSLDIARTGDEMKRYVAELARQRAPYELPAPLKAIRDTILKRYRYLTPACALLIIAVILLFFYPRRPEDTVKETSEIVTGTKQTKETFAPTTDMVPSTGGPVVSVTLLDGRRIYGRLLSIDADKVCLKNSEGEDVEIPRSKVAAIEHERQTVE